MKKIILLTLILKSLLVSNDLFLREYIQMVSSSLNITIVVDEVIDNEFSIYVSSDFKNKLHLNVLKQVLKANNLKLTKFKSFYLVSNIENKNIDTNLIESELNHISLKNIDYEMIKPLFTVYKDLSHTYIPTSKLLIINSSNKQYKDLKSLISKLDILPNQLKLKITVLNTNIDLLKDYGSQFIQEKNLSSNSNFFFNLLAYPFTVNSQVNSSQSSNFKMFIKFLNQNKITKLTSSPVITLFDNKKSSFDVVKNIPYLKGSTTVEDNNSKTTNSYEYKDIGLKINIVPKIYKDKAYLDLQIINESILDTSDTPSTSKSSLKQFITLEKNKMFVLTGINQTENFEDLQGIPKLENIPLLGWLFKTDNKKFTNTNMTIIFELVDGTNYTPLTNAQPLPIFKTKEQLSHDERVKQILGY